jgi:CheY-like chemotaxis protein
MEDRPCKILYVEDQSEMIELVQLALQCFGCEVRRASDGLQALDWMRSNRVDLVLLDLMLPGCDGWQVVEAMQADALLKDLPVILVTARVAHAGTGRQPPPAHGYITKPFSLEELRSAVQSVLRLPRKLAQAI